MNARFTLFGIGAAILTLLTSLSSLALEPALMPSYPFYVVCLVLAALSGICPKKDATIT